MTPLVSFNDYQDVSGFGVQSAEHLQNLQKALTAGQSINPPGAVTAGDGFALRVESLERTLKNVTFKMENLRFWRQIPKIAAYNTVEEFNQIQEYGTNQDSAFISEGALPEEQDTTYERKFAVVKYMGVVRRVTHVMSLVRPAHGNVIAQETINGTMDLLRKVEINLYEGDSNVSPLQWDGYRALLQNDAPAANIIDLRGQPLSEDILMDAALTIQDAPNFGTPTHLHLNPKVKADLIKQFFPKARYDLYQKSDSGLLGLDTRGFTSPAGDIMFEPNVFITDGGGPSAAAVGDAARRPSDPVISTSVTTPSNNDSLFDEAGSFFVSVQAVNRFGRSAAVPLNSGNAIAVAAGDSINFSLTAGADADFYAIYRGTTSGNQRLVARIPATGATPVDVVDLNTKIPGTTEAYLFQQNLENMSFKQLAPMVKIPLATIDSSIRWMQLIYGVPVLYTPGKNVLFTNVGRASGFVGQP